MAVEAEDTAGNVVEATKVQGSALCSLGLSTTTLLAQAVSAQFNVLLEGPPRGGGGHLTESGVVLCTEPFAFPCGTQPRNHRRERC